MNAYRYRVTADTQYLDGPLAGVTMPAGYSVPCPDYRHARRVAAWIDRMRAGSHPVTATGTRSRYTFTSPATIANEVQP